MHSDSKDLSELYAAIRNIINLQEANLPDASAVMENNWNGLLILSELEDWVETIAD